MPNAWSFVFLLAYVFIITIPLLTIAGMLYGIYRVLYEIKEGMID
jgi:hypothetical protein